MRTGVRFAREAAELEATLVRAAAILLFASAYLALPPLIARDQLSASVGETAEALSGLARAFFYAGARALLVSHWEVGSDAAVKLTTRAFAELKANPKIGRAEAPFDAQSH
jgi:hypothetical protein